MIRDLQAILVSYIPSRTILSNCIELLKRERTGIQKYGVTLDNAQLTHEQLLQHLLEEQLDAANYTRAALMRASAAHLDYALLRKDLEECLNDMDKVLQGNYRDPDSEHEDALNNAYDTAINDALRMIREKIMSFDSNKVLRDLRK